MSDTLKILDNTGKEIGEKNISWLEKEKGDEALHLAVTALRAGERNGTASTKSRSQIALTGKKPWKQKGTGRARAGTASSPIWRGGGVAFGPKARSYTKKVNKKVAQLALRRAFTKQVEAGNVIVINDIQFAEYKTKLAVDLLKTLDAENRAIVILNDTVWSDNLEKTERCFWNLASAIVLGVSELNSYDVLLGKKLIITESALDLLTQRVTRKISKGGNENA